MRGGGRRQNPNGPRRNSVARRDRSAGGEVASEEVAVAADAGGGQLSRRLQALEPRRRDGVPAHPDEIETPVAPQKRDRRDLAAGRPTGGGRGDSEFLASRLTIDDAPPSPIRWRVILGIAGFLITAAAWSYFGRIASYTSSMGKIQVAGRTKVVEALAPGKVIKIAARDGDAVAAGAILVELDPTAALANRTIIEQNLTNLRAETLRLETEIKAARIETIDPATKIPWDKDVPSDVRRREDGVARADLGKLAAQIATLLSQKHAKEAERDKYVSSIAAQKALVTVTQENLAMVQSLLQSGYNSQAKFLDMKAQLDGQQVTQTAYEGSLEDAKQAILMIVSEIATLRETFVKTATQTVSTNEQTIVDLAQQFVRADQFLSNMTLRATATGVVHATAVTTIGQVVKPSQQLMQIVPRDAPLEIQAYVSNTDIGFIRKGDPATIKVNAFTYGTYGSIDGTVTDISNDALALQAKSTVQSSSLDGEYNLTSTAQKTGNIQFPITVRAARSTMMVDGKEIPLVSGMGVTVEILTENRRAIDYVVSPLEELFSTAGHER